MGGKGTGKRRKEERVIESLDNGTVLGQLLGLARHLGMTVRQEIGEFKGGSCRVADSRLVILKKSDPDTLKIDVLTRELASAPSDDFEIDSALRHYLEQCKKKYDGPV